ncbi:MAG: PVC-type heme-binding CxxCH protein [Gemmataceae bacterium]
MIRCAFLATALGLLGTAVLGADAPKPLKILFLGDRGHHQPAARFRQLQPVLAKRGIDLVYTESADALNPKVLAGYDGLLVYANIDEIKPEQEKALLDFVAGGKGFIPLHCASFCFRNSPKYVELVGAQFQRHSTGTFRTTIAAPDHPVMKGFKGFESWDETYVHTKHNEKDRTILEYREEGGKKEPWTWVRTHGKGRVFYTAWGHDERTWGHPGFQNLIERGIRWACGADPSVAPVYAEGGKPEMTPIAKDAPPFEYVPANVPFYPPSPRWGVTAEPIKKMQKPLSAADSMKHISVPADFELKLFVDETQLGGGKPICMTWDERGRLWVALTYDYPNEKKPEGEGRDRIVICEDTTGKGVCGKVTVFAEKLSIPTSLVCAYGGVIVHQAPHTLFLKDTTGDGKADFKQILFTGWGTSDTHAGPSNLRYGFDNWFYGIVGYSAFRGTVGGEQHDFRQGFYRFKVEKEPTEAHKLKVTKMEFLRSTSNNSWGVGFSEDGQLFGSTANGCPIVHMPIPNRYYEKVRGLNPSVLANIAPDNHFEPITDKVRQVDWHGGFTAAAGCGLYTARNYPKDYWNRVAFVCEPTGHLVAAFVLEPDGATYKARYGWNLLASDDEWCAPIDAQIGPDGSVWVIDWYNFIVQHNPTPPGWRTGRGAAYETELRDKKYGRVYRVVPKNAKPVAGLRLDNATPDQLVAALKNDNMFWRQQAQRLLVEQGNRGVESALLKLTHDKGVDEVGLNPGAVHALWTLHGLDMLNCDKWNDAMVAGGAILHPSPSVQLTALQALPRLHNGPCFLDGLGKDKVAMIAPKAQVAFWIAIAEMGQGDNLAVDLVVQMLRRETTFRDRVLLDAVTVTAANNAYYVLKAVATLEQVPPEAEPVVKRIAAHFAATEDAKDVSELLVQIAQKKGRACDIVISGLAAGWPTSRHIVLTADAEKAVAKLVTDLPSVSRAKLLRLASIWGVKGLDAQLGQLTTGLCTTLADAKSDDDARIDAAKQLVALRPEDDAAATKVIDIVTPLTSPHLAAGLFDALSASTAKAVGPTVAAKLKDFTPAVRAAGIRLLLGRVDTIRALLDAMDKGQVQFTDLALDQRQALASHTDRQIAGRAKAILARGGGLPDPDRQKVIDQFIAVTKKTGDADAGKLIFKNNCMKCHRHSGEGEQIGPDLTGMAVHPKEHLLVDILDPSRSVEGNFRVWRVEMKDGRSFSGMLAAETKTSVELIDAEAKRHTLQRSDIEELQASNKSLMPEGFEKQVKPDDLANLLEFLTKKGKYVPIPLDRAANVVTTKGMFFREDSTTERLVFADWSPKTVDGVTFYLIDPKGDTVNNAVMLYGPQGRLPPKMPRAVTLPCNAPAKAVHFLSGVSGWGFAGGTARKTVSMIVRLHYDDGKTEDHPLRDGEHFADYIRRVDVPGSKFAFALRGQQIRFLSVTPQRQAMIKEIELLKGQDATAPVVMAVTVETP